MSQNKNIALFYLTDKKWKKHNVVCKKINYVFNFNLNNYNTASKLFNI